MFLDFAVGNFLSFNEPTFFTSTGSADIDEYPDNVFKAGEHTFPRTIAIYGANASGKSNFIKALWLMNHFVLSDALPSNQKIYAHEPFLLENDTQNKPSYFDIRFLDGEDFKTIYRYGFEVTQTEVSAEWLFIDDKEIFVRESGKSIEVDAEYSEIAEIVNKLEKGDKIRLNPTALLLTKLDSEGVRVAQQIRGFFQKYHTINALEPHLIAELTIKMIEIPELKPKLESFFQWMQLGFEEIKLENIRPSDTPGFIKTDLKTKHIQKDGKAIYFDLEKQESKGTEKNRRISGKYIKCFSRWLYNIYRRIRSLYTYAA